MSEEAPKKKHKKRKKRKQPEIELNIMPFIDIFSLLNTFLLMSAVFLSVGILEVQVPFLTSAPPEKSPDERAFEVKVEMEKDKVTVTGSFSKPPVNEQKKDFKLTKEDLQQMHTFLLGLRRGNPEQDKVSLFTEDDVIWKDLSHVLDMIKVRQPADPVFAAKGASEIEKAVNGEFLYPKVVMSSVML